MNIKKKGVFKNKLTKLVDTIVNSIIEYHNEFNKKKKGDLK